MQLVIRPFRPSDKDAAHSLFSFGNNEFIIPAFNNAMTSPLYLAITLALCITGFLLGSVLGALVLTGVWVGLVYYSCHDLFAGYVKEKLKTDMQDIPGYYQSRLDDSFWVAEAEVDGRPQILGTVAVVTKDSGKEKYGELCRLNVSPSCRRMGLGTKLAWTVINFCKERGFSKVVLETSSIQTSAVALYLRLGFREFLRHTELTCYCWVLTLSKVKIVNLEKHL
ncbi:putative N-acetyltransferase camello [Halichoeres trimaculatus]|uniref:putative N-acetyltransferase camello n=1 Tax=Halichoeres trimaculatus TaxID=147232 RepID=UPI003D9ED1A3